MIVSIENIVDEAIDNGWLSDCLVTEEYDFVFEQWWDGSSLAEVKVAKVGHTLFLNLKL